MFTTLIMHKYTYKGHTFMIHLNYVIQYNFGPHSVHELHLMQSLQQFTRKLPLLSSRCDFKMLRLQAGKQI